MDKWWLVSLLFWPKGAKYGYTPAPCFRKLQHLFSLGNRLLLRKPRQPMSRKMGGVTRQPIAARSGAQARRWLVSWLVKETKPGGCLRGGEYLQISWLYLSTELWLVQAVTARPSRRPAGVSWKGAGTTSSTFHFSLFFSFLFFFLMNVWF